MAVKTRASFGLPNYIGCRSKNRQTMIYGPFWVPPQKKYIHIHIYIYVCIWVPEKKTMTSTVTQAKMGAGPAWLRLNQSLSGAISPARM